MATYHVTAPTGETYEVTGPDGATNDQVLAQVQAQHAQPASTSAPQQSGALSSGDPVLDTMGGMVMDQAHAGLGQMAHGASQIFQQQPSDIPGVESYPSQIARVGERVGEGAMNFATGAVKYLGSPIAPLTAPRQDIYHRFVGDPITRATGSPALGQFAEGLTGDALEMGAMGGFRAPEIVRGAPVEPAAAVTEAPAPRTQISPFAAGTTAEAQRASVIDNLRQAKNDAYQRSEQAQVIIKPDALKVAEDAIHKDLADFSYEPSQQPGIAPILSRIAKVTNGESNITLKGLDTIRKGAVNLTRDFNNPSQQAAAGIVIEHLDNMPLSQNDVIIPPGTDFRQALNDLFQGRSLAKTVAKADKIDQALTVAKNNADKSGSGANVENATRQALGSILNRIDRGKDRSFSPTEVAQMRAAVRGGSVNNLLRYLGRWSPEHPLIATLAATGAGTAIGGPLGAGVGATVMGTGWASKLASEGINRYRANTLFNTVARGKPARQFSAEPSPPNFYQPAPNGSGRGPQGPVIPPAARLPAPRTQPSIGNTMYSNPLDPAAIKALFFKGRPPPAVAAQGARAMEADAPLTLGPENEAQIAYHGTPHDFERFDSSQIGSGEGNQAYGHGLYFAQNEGVARGYRDALKTSAGQVILNEAGGKRALPDPTRVGISARGLTPEQLATSSLYYMQDVGRAQTSLEQTASRLADTAKEHLDSVQQIGRSYPRRRAEAAAFAESVGQDAQRYQQAADWLRANGDKVEIGPPSPGKVYQVAIKARPEEFLDWDKNFSQQSPEVKGALKRLGFKGSETDSGSQIYNTTIRRQIQNAGPFKVPTVRAADAAAQLRYHGIKGIRYLDQLSRVGGGGTSNYVIFDDKIISVLKKYSIPMTITATGAALVSGVNLPPDIKRQLEN